jgi:hypothetical protein
MIGAKIGPTFGVSVAAPYRDEMERVHQPDDAVKL